MATEPGAEGMAKIIEGFRLIGQGIGLAATVSDPPRPAASLSTSELLRQQKEDLAWLITQQRLMEGLQGTYVALYQRGIVCSGPSEELVRMGGADKLGISPADVLVVPISVPGDTSWDGLKARFGIETG